jgi:MFS family permease
VLTLGLALLSAAFPPERRGAAIGLFSAVTGLAVASGPLVGGAIAEGLAWEWIFWLNVPIGLAAIPLVLTRIEESIGGDTGLDLPGLGLIGAAAFGIVWGLVRGHAAGWGSPEVVGARPAAPGGVHRPRAAGAGADAADAPLPLPRHLGRERGDLLDLRLPVRRRLLLRADAADGARLRAARRRPAPDPLAITFITVAPVAGALADRFGQRPFMVGGLTLQAVGMGWVR